MLLHFRATSRSWLPKQCGDLEQSDHDTSNLSSKYLCPCVLNTTNPSSTATAASAIPTTLGYSGCNVSNGTQHTSSVLIFTRLCNLDWSLGTDDLTYGGIRTAILNACIDEYASWQGFRCLSVTHLTEGAMKNVESCFLEDSLPSYSTNLTEVEGIEGALLNAVWGTV